MDTDIILCGDAKDILMSIPSGSIDLVFTDPPYGTKTYNTDIVIDDDIWNGIRRVGTNLYAIWGYAKHLMEWSKHFSDLKLLDYVVWIKYNEPNVSISLTRYHQDIAIWGVSKKQIHADRVRMPYSDNGALARFYSKGGTGEKAARLRSARQERHPDGARCPDVWPIAAPHSGFSGHKNRLHPNEKPIEAATRALLLLTDPGDIVLDPFCGSGTIPLACKLTNRRYIGIERDERFYSVSRDRIYSSEESKARVDATSFGEAEAHHALTGGI